VSGVRPSSPPPRPPLGRTRPLAARRTARRRRIAPPCVTDRFTPRCARSPTRQRRPSRRSRAGAEVPFELDPAGATGARRSRSTPLYCYRPLTGAFIRERLGRLAQLPTYTPAARALEPFDGVDAYLRQQGAAGRTPLPRDRRDRADAALRVLLDRLFDGSSDFALTAERFARAYEELEALLDAGTEPVATLVVGLPGLRLASPEVPLAQGIVLCQADAVGDAPPDALWLGAVGDEPNTLPR
jgi:hypothetical protein